jgi:hypothetical protein
MNRRTVRRISIKRNGEAKRRLCHEWGMAMAPEVGQQAPDFRLSSTLHKEKVQLSDYRGKKTILLAFYPLAFTPG